MMTDPGKRQSPRGNAGFVKTTDSTLQHAQPTIGLDRLLPLLNGVRRSGDSYRADCPVGHRSRGTLSLAEGRDGHVVLHCFGGCHAADVLGAIGLSLGDLFPSRQHPLTKDERRKLSDRARIARWEAGINVVLHEAAVCEVILRDLIADQSSVGPDGLARLVKAASEITRVRVEIARLEPDGIRPGRAHRDLGMAHLEPPVMRKEAA